MSCQHGYLRHLQGYKEVCFFLLDISPLHHTLWLYHTLSQTGHEMGKTRQKSEVSDIALFKNSKGVKKKRGLLVSERMLFILVGWVWLAMPAHH